VERLSPEGWGARKNVARQIKVETRERRGCTKSRWRIDVVGNRPTASFRLHKEGIKIVRRQQLMSDARVIKTKDEDFFGC